MNRALNVTRMHFVKRSVLVAPIGIMALVVFITCMIAFVMQRAGMDTNSVEWEQGFKNNGAAIWSFPGFYVYLGVQAVSTTFPYGMALGTTRKSYALGTSVFYVAQAVYTALLGLVLLGVEKITGGWFVNSYVFNVTFLGSGSPIKLVLMMFSIALFALCVGGLFGAMFVRLGPKGPLLLSAALVVVLAIALLVLAPQFQEIFKSLTLLKSALTLMAAAALSMGGLYFGLRSATVR